ncbi:MAG: hypothetical protein NUW23_02885 [Firmicutes bacterium]|jgi:hypothetical protein|nr:hypothetical protein [Bacillota bacterium]
MDVIMVLYRAISACIGLGFLVNACRTKNRAEQFVSAFVMLPFLLRALGLK